MAKIESAADLQAQLYDLLKTVDGVLRDSNVNYFLAAGTALGAEREGDLIPWDYDIDLLVPIRDYARALRVLRQDLPIRYAVAEPLVDPLYEHLFSRVYLATLNHKYIHADLFPLVGTFRYKGLQLPHLWLSKWCRRFYFLRQRSVAGDMPARRVLRWAGSLLQRLPAAWFVAAFWSLGRVRKMDSADTVTNLAAGYMTRECVPKYLFEVTGSRSLRGREFPVPEPIHEYLRSLYGDYMAQPSVAQQAKELAKFDSWYRAAVAPASLDLED